MPYGNIITKSKFSFIYFCLSKCVLKKNTQLTVFLNSPTNRKFLQEAVNKGLIELFCRCKGYFFLIYCVSDKNVTRDGRWCVHWLCITCVSARSGDLRRGAWARLWRRLLHTVHPVSGPHAGAGLQQQRRPAGLGRPSPLQPGRRWAVAPSLLRLKSFFLLKTVCFHHIVFVGISVLYIVIIVY